MSAQQIGIECDCTFDEVDFDEYDYVVLPGGMPGTTHLRQDPRVCDVVSAFATTKHVAAICAAPSILGELGLLVGRKATCSPGSREASPPGRTRAARPSSWTATSSPPRGWARRCPSPSPCSATSPAIRYVDKVSESIQL